MLHETREAVPVRLFGASEPTSIEVFQELAPTGTWTVLALHGYGDNLTTWQTLRTLLQPHGARFVSIDLPGHGRTPLPPGFAAHYSHNCCELIHATLAQHAARPVLVVGNSMGGSLALGTAVLDQALGEQARIGGLVLCAPATEQTRTPYFIRLLKIPTYTWLDALSRRLPRRSHRAAVRAMTRTAFRAMLGPGKRPPAPWFESVFESLARPGAWLDLEAIARDLMHVLRGERAEVNEIRARIPALRYPSIFLRGDRDIVIGEAELVDLAARMPDARFESLPGVGHCPQNEAPEVTARAVLELAARAGYVGRVP